MGQVGLEPLAARLLWSRGIRETKAAAEFREAPISGLHDPGLLPGLDTAATRILEALQRHEPVVVYGDYDVDGVCASAILFRVCRAIVPGAPISTYVPSRLDEGYGLHAGAVAALAREGARVIISVDCGITAFEAAAAARAGGADLIITDHHSFHVGSPSGSPQVPDAFAVVHPRLPGSAYPFAELCGAGVAFKLAWRLATLAAGTERVSSEMRSLLLDMLALAALGTVADIVPLTGENRVIARHGLRRLRSTSIIGLGALIDASGLTDENVDAESVGLILGPRLNACGRMGHARQAVELLTTNDRARAAEIARELSRLNDARRRAERAMFDEAAPMAERAGMTGPDRRAIVLAAEGWSQGIVGIVCSRLVDRFHRPTILLRREDGLCHGSARSIDGFSMLAALQECSGLLRTFGGHDMAAGLTLDAVNFTAFVDRFVDLANASLESQDLTRSLRIDCPARIDELTPLALEQVSAFGPFGRGNPSPSILIESVAATRAPEPLGAGGAHASFFARQDRRELRILGWNWGARRRDIPHGVPLDLVVEPKISTWNGRSRVEAVLRDVRVRESAPLAVPA